MFTFAQVLFFHIDAQADIASAAGAEAVLDVVQVTGHQRKQVSGLGKGVLPAGPVPAPGQVLDCRQVAVAEQYRVARLVGVDAYSEHRHHIGPIGVVGNLAKTVGLALGAEHGMGLIQPVQRGVVPGMDPGPALQLKAGGHHGDFEPLRSHGKALGAQLLSIQAQAEQLEPRAVQLQGCRRARALAAHQLQPRSDQGMVLPQLEMQFGMCHQVGRWPVIPEVNRGWLGISHGGSRSGMEIKSCSRTTHSRRTCAC